jgi:amidase/aspartyl-tRNA(Asn)/glutamyl-tRNA(Gln) amidotransferase subunit A
LLSTEALQGKRIGLYGPGWNAEQPSPETRALYETALETLKAEGAILIEDPFADSGIRRLAVSFFNGLGDWRGYESMVFDLEQYLDRLFGEDSEEVTSLDMLRSQTGVNLVDNRGLVRVFVDQFDVSLQSLNNPEIVPDLSEFSDVRQAYRDVLTSVLNDHELDALVFPQMLHRTPALHSDENIASSTVDAINILGTPGVTVPAGYYENGAPFSLMFMGDAFSEAELLALAYDYEQATLHRTAPHLIHLADANEDGMVDFADFLVVAGNFGQRRRGAGRGDFNDDRQVDFSDFVFLSQHYGYGTEAVAAVPEPAANCVHLLATLILSVFFRERRPGA